MADSTRRPLPLQEELLRLLCYDPETGALTWRVSFGRARADSPAGWWQPAHGGVKRRRVCIRGIRYYSARLIWRMQTGEDPGELRLDHKERNPEDERWESLRLANRSQSMQNRASRNDLPRGVCWDKARKRYMAQIKVYRRRLYLGRFHTPEEAAAAYDKAALEHHGEFAVLNNIKQT